MGYQNALIQGEWDPRVIKHYARLGITIETKNREMLPVKKVILDGIKRNKLIRSMSYEDQNRLKRFLKKLGIDFIT